MKNLLPLVLVWLFIPLSGFAASVEPKPLEDLVKESDHVLIATVFKVDMVNGRGEEIKDTNAMTGPGLDNEIRFHLEVKEVLFTKSPQPPKRVMVRLWNAWHFRLGDLQETVAATSIFLLKGNEYDPVYPAGFQCSLDQQEEIQGLIKKI